jgi:hypothetical protein
LSIAAKIVESHGGRLEAVNCPGGGAEFSIYLPEVTGSWEPRGAPGEPREADHGTGSEAEESGDWGRVMEESRNAG